MSKIKDKCPYCGKNDCIPEVAYMYAERYGTETHHVKCVHCLKIIFVGFARILKLTCICKTDRTEADWS